MLEEHKLQLTVQCAGSNIVIKYSRAVALCLVLCVTSNNICKPVALFVELMITGRIQSDDDCINIGYVINQTAVVALK
jgi:hypothetical protein